MELAGRLQILIVTPERTIFQHWSKLLRESGVRHFHHATDAPSLLRHLRNGVIDVIFVDGIIRFINPLQLSAVLGKAMQQLKREMPGLVLCQNEAAAISKDKLDVAGYDHQIITPILKAEPMARVIEEILLAKKAGYEMARVKAQPAPVPVVPEEDKVAEHVPFLPPRGGAPVPPSLQSDLSDADVAFL